MASHKDLCQKRKQIDRLDAKLLQLINQRARVASEVALIKKSRGLAVYDRQREREVLDRLSRQNPGPVDPQGLVRIFRSIMRESRKLQESAMRQIDRKHSPVAESGRQCFHQSARSRV